MSIQSLLIANRGEIACRVIRTAKSLGIRTVAVFSDADKHALHVQLADEAVYLGGPAAKDSYLRADAIIEQATALNIDAIHPGYGFLSENANFAEQCQQAGIIFVGPPSSAIEAMGSKSAAKTIMEQAGVPLVPGYHGDDQSAETLKYHADAMGYPVLLKAAAGGGGKGMRVVESEEVFHEAFDAAKREAMSSFGDDIMLVEKYLTQPRHVEIQVFCDSHGNGVYLFERDCSLQRRHQKVIEEAPAPGLPEDIRQAMGEAALKAAQAIGYEGAGTVEFLLDYDNSFYFMEMNTRLQVEHPVTEMITGEDLVAWQLAVADGQVLPKQQSELRLHGHAFEARIYAEDPYHNFLPQTGTLTYLTPPAPQSWLRTDTGVQQGDEVSVYYDPMIAKLIVWGEDREQALARLQQALRDYRIAGVTTNTAFLATLASTPDFAAANLTTTFIDKHIDELTQNRSLIAEHGDNTGVSLGLVAIAAFLARKQLAQHNTLSKQPSNNDAHTLWANPMGWRMNHPVSHSVDVMCDEALRHFTLVQSNNLFTVHQGEKHWDVTLLSEAQGNCVVTLNGHRQSVSWCLDDAALTLFTHWGSVVITLHSPDLGADDHNNHDQQFNAPMNGTVVKLLVKPGENVAANTPLMIMEAMKMEHTIRAPKAGAVECFYCKEGELVDGGAPLLAFEADDA